jgi:hypothetical protein
MIHVLGEKCTQLVIARARKGNDSKKKKVVRSTLASVGTAVWTIVKKL